MNLFRVIENNKLLTFMGGTVLIQAFIFSLTAYLHSYSPYSSQNFGSERVRAAEISSTAIVQQEEVKQQTGSQEISSAPSQAAAARTQIYKIAAGDTLTKVWTKNGASSSGGIKAAAAFKKAGVPLNTLRLGQEVQLTLSEKNDIVEFSMKLPQGKSLKLTGNSAAGYQADLNEPKILERERTVSYPIINSFSASAREVNVPLAIIDDLVDLFSGRLDFRKDLQPGDAFTVIYTERVTEDGEALDPGPIKAISIDTGGKMLVAIGHPGQDGKQRFFNEVGEQLGNYFLRYPLRFTRISSIFSESRFHPILKIRRPHNGVDFAAPQGTAVRSVGDGVVEAAGYGNGTGNVVKIRHDDRFTTAYMHLYKIASGIRPGTRITRGDLIGQVGMTGLATAPHLHFSLYDRNVFIDPLTSNLPVTSPSENAIPKTYLTSTLQVLKRQHDLVRFAALMGLTKNV